MTNKEGLDFFKDKVEWYENDYVSPNPNNKQISFYKMAIKALERDAKVDYITEHWNDEKSTFVSACSAFEDILQIYGRGVNKEAEE